MMLKKQRIYFMTRIFNLHFISSQRTVPAISVFKSILSLASIVLLLMILTAAMCPVVLFMHSHTWEDMSAGEEKRYDMTRGREGG